MELVTTRVASPARVATSVVVRPARDTDAAAWDAFVQRCPEATFFSPFRVA